ncbi:GDSL-type esterase/lipase family protein [Virgibacillus sp. C22-A2]|uniref:GDSL-type esterase/lipase family protein n=1 Tax=Virgibacillus tibetensis TaxID=3042313 RepID=A0ABU6KDH9_9BACI|nr:GDSL-type esterase/lipase family protein [Virgibacillus sp. C22-A2]
MKQTIKLISVLILAVFILLPQAVIASEEKSDLNYMAIGDSLAEGLSFDGMNFINGYPDQINNQLVEKLPYLNINYTNAGVSGYTTNQVLSQVMSDDDVRKALQEADIITISAGANDLLQVVDMEKLMNGSSEDQLEVIKAAEAAINGVVVNLGSIIGEINQVNPEASIFVMGYYNAMPYLVDMQDLVIQLIAGLNQGIKAAAETGAYYVPIFDVFHGNYEEYLPNPENIHPNEAGYKAIADVFLNYIVADLGEGHWVYSNNKPDDKADIGASYYVHVTTLDIYEKVKGKWELVGNYKEGTGAIDELSLLYGNGIPPKDAGYIGQYYLDVENKYLYLKHKEGWLGEVNLVNEEPIDDPVYDEEPVDHEQVIVNNEAVEAVKKDGVLRIDFKEALKVSEVTLSAEQVKMLQEKRAVLAINKEDVALTIPSGLLGDGTEAVTITVTDQGYTPDSLSKVYDFTIQIGEKYLRQFNEHEVTLYFKVDEAKVKNTENLKVYFFNEETEEWVVIGGSYMDGAVVAATSHFSKFTVFEMEEEEIIDEVKEEEPKAESEENGTGKADDVKNAGKKSDEEKKNKGTGKLKTNAEEKEESALASTKQGGKQLPETATNMYNWIFAGSILLLTGGVMLIVSRRKAVY